MGLHSRAIVLIPLTTIETKGNPMKKTEASRMAQEVILEAIKAGAAPNRAGTPKEKGEHLAEFITSAHQVLLEYYEKIEHQSQ